MRVLKLKDVFFHKMKKILLLILVPFLFSCDQIDPKVKKSKAGICHEVGTRYYKQTKYFEKYSSIEDCIKSGGRLPKRR